MSGQISAYFVGYKGGLMMSVIAFSTVFLVIVGLMLLMMALKHFAGTINAMSAAKQAPSAPAPSAPAPKPTSPMTAVAAQAEDGELLAVITAAIAVACGAGARVVSFRPAPPRTQGTPWRMTGRLQNSEGFLD